MNEILNLGDNMDVLRTVPDNSIDSCVTDPPYGLAFMGNRWDYDVPTVDTWREVYRVLKPGAHLLSFFGTRTYHRGVVAIEDARFEIRDQIGWVYGSGFPKSHNIGDGRGTALKPAWEPIVVARKPLDGTVAATVDGWGTGALNIDACRVEVESTDRGGWRLGCYDKTYKDGALYGQGVGTKIGRQQPQGRWPANVIHDGGQEVLDAFAAFGHKKSRGNRNSSLRSSGSAFQLGNNSDCGGQFNYDEGGTAARFFYSAKASASERAGRKHPTIKPLSLMRYLCRLVTPPNGVVLDPFAGSGTTIAAALLEGFQAIGIERDEAYFAEAQAYLEAMTPKQTSLVLGN